MNLRETYNLIADDWHTDHKESNWWVEGTDAFIQLLPKGCHVLDVGCAGGVKTKYLSSKGFTLTGIDLSDNFIEIARRHVPQAHLEVMDMRDLAKLPGQFEGIFAQASLLHIPKKEIVDVLNTLISKLKPGGLLYIAVKGIRPDRVEEETREENDYGYPYKRFFSYFNMTELKKYLLDAQLEIVYENSKIVGKTEWLQVVGRK
jgi:2-polyprenyl-3-methyl-5-hydroxy-6-metoxy-1,4-benzoquinol methylase